MPRAVLLAFTAPKTHAQTDEYNDWYDNVHLDDVLAVPGVLSAARYRLSDEQFPADDAPAPYVAIYEIEADDLSAIGHEMDAAHQRGDMPVSGALHVGPVFVYELITEPRTSDSTEPRRDER